MATVLIVDDDAALREGVSETLADLGHRAAEAADGAAALASKPPSSNLPAPRPAFPEPLTRFRAEISGALRDAAGSEALPLYSMVRYHMGWEDGSGAPAEAEGKGVRPSLTLLCAQAVSGSHKPALPAAVAIELAHNFSLVHDDIQDEDEERRVHEGFIVDEDGEDDDDVSRH